MFEMAIYTSAQLTSMSDDSEMYTESEREAMREELRLRWLDDDASAEEL